VYVSGRPFQVSARFESKARAYLMGAPGLTRNIRLDWKGLPGTNAQAYLDKWKAGKKLHSKGPW